MKLLERRDAECGALVGDMNARNFNISAGVEQLQHNLTAHQQVRRALLPTLPTLLRAP